MRLSSLIILGIVITVMGIIVSSSFAVIFICRRGNDSQVAVNMLKTKLNVKSIYDVEGGLHAWATKIDKQFPIY